MMQAPKPLFVTITGILLCIVSLTWIVILQCSGKHVHMPVFTGTGIEFRGIGLGHSAADFLHDAIAHDRCGQSSLATEDLRSCRAAGGFEELEPRERKSLREVIDSRYNADAPDFFQELACHDRLYYWPVQRLPIRVYIPGPRERDGFAPKDRVLIIDCLNEWVSVLPNCLSYRLVSQKDRADMVFTRKRDSAELAASRAPIAHTSPIAEGALNWQAGRISKAKILIAQPDGATTPRNVFLHEIGHALGLAGHSCNASDAMFPYINYDSRSSLSQRDKQTIRLLYGTASPETLAERCIRARAAAGDKYAQYRLAIWLLTVASINQANKEEGMKLLSCAAAQGLPAAMKYLGDIAFYGGVGRCDSQRALNLWEEAAARDDPDALLALAKAYRCGYGVMQDNSRAEQYYRRAVQMDSLDAEVEYADFLCAKEFPDKLEASRYYTLAAESYSTAAMYQLGRLLLAGDCIPYNARAAKYWHTKAVETIQRCRPCDAAGYLHRAKQWQSIGYWSDAIADAKRAEYLEPNLPGMQALKAECYFRAGDFQQSEVALSRANIDDFLALRQSMYLSSLNQLALLELGKIDYTCDLYLSTCKAPDKQRAYVLLNGALAHRLSSDGANERRYIEASMKELSGNEWPMPLLKYFAGQCTVEEVYAQAAGDQQQQEAHAICGISRAAAGQYDQAREDLLAVKEQGDARNSYWALAVQQLNKIPMAANTRGAH